MSRRLAVLMTAYNAEKTIGKAIESDGVRLNFKSTTNGNGERVRWNVKELLKEMARRFRFT